MFVVDWSNNRILKVNASGASLSFANTRTGATSSDSPKTVTVTNLGNEALTFSSNPSYTTDFSENSSDENLCTSSTSLDPSEVCDVSVLFTPQSAGSKNQFVVLTNNHLNASAATQSISVSGSGVEPVTPTITWVQPSAITYGTTLTGILNATANDGSSPVEGTFAYTATPQGGSASTVTDASILCTGTYTLSVAFTPSNLNYTSASGSVSLTVNKAAPAVSLVSSANPVLLSNRITLTATVSSSAETPTGSVNFYDGTTRLGSGTLSSGVATYATSSLTAATHSITAVYSGDSHYLSVTSSAVSQVVSDLALNAASGGSTTATVSAGGTATYNLTIAPSAGTVFPAAVTLSATGGPAGSTITITPQTIAAGSPSTNVTVTVQLSSASAHVRRSTPWTLAFAFPLMGMLLLPFGVNSRRASPRPVLFPVLLLMVLVCIGAAVGCGNSSQQAPPNQSTNYTITLTATSGNISHATSLTLTVR